MVWKGGYDEYLRGYKYTYDKANRLLTSDYGFKFLNSYNSMVWDFSMKYNESIGSYDRNGNITQLNRYHGSWNQVDNLHYVGWDGNKVLHITDWITANVPVGFTDHESYFDDYQYDQNGNMTFDYNKGVTAITYNHLNLPTLVTMGTKGTIAYTYDAAGNKLQKTVTDQTVSPNKISNFYYAGAFVYRSSYLSGNTPGLDTLELATHEEGRLRPTKIDTTQALSPANLKFIYDYFLKDHLGNVRMVVTTETQTDKYAATMEPANAAKENLLFNNIVPYLKPGGFDTVSANTQVVRLNGNINTTGNNRVGPSLVIKVMAGDTISLSSFGWYNTGTQAPPPGLPPIANDLVPLLSNGIIANNGIHGGTIQTTDINSGVTSVIGDFLTNTQTYNSSRPKAFMNWMIVDEEFKKVSSTNHMGAVQLPLMDGTAPKVQLVGPSNMVVRRNGWLYVYLSNESNQNVYFDDLIVNHKRGPVVEATDYYAFGLQIPGLSTQANKGQSYNPNRYKYNSIEQTNELDLNIYDAHFRNLDPQIGRFWQIDAKLESAEGWSPYSAMLDNPIRYSDPLGDSAAWFRPDGSFWKFVADGKKTWSGVFYQNATTKTSISNGVEYNVTTYSDGINFKFNDPDVDILAIKNGVESKGEFGITGVALMTDQLVNKLIDESNVKTPGAQNNPYSYARKQGKYLMDYGVRGIKGGDLDPKKFYLRDKIAYNVGDAGNYLWGRGMGYLLFPLGVAQMGAHYNNIFHGSDQKTDYYNFGPGTYGDPGFWDSPGDQRAITAGWYSSPPIIEAAKKNAQKINNYMEHWKPYQN